MKKIAIALLFALSSSTVFSQDFNVPKNFDPKSADDYTRYHQDVIDAFDWLMQTPLKSQPRKRKDVNAFLLKWLTGSPTVHIEIKSEIVTFMNSSPDLLMIFMGGWAKYSLESEDADNKIEGTMAGLESVITFYTKNKPSLGKDKNVEKYIKMKSKGKLKSFVKENA